MCERMSYLGWLDAPAGFDLETSPIGPDRIGEAPAPVATVLHGGRRATFTVHLPESQS
jgi:hypothetical protein